MPRRDWQQWPRRTGGRASSTSKAKSLLQKSKRKRAAEGEAVTRGGERLDGRIRQTGHSRSLLCFVLVDKSRRVAAQSHEGLEYEIVAGRLAEERRQRNANLSSSAGRIAMRLMSVFKDRRSLPGSVSSHYGSTRLRASQEVAAVVLLYLALAAARACDQLASFLIPYQRRCQDQLAWCYLALPGSTYCST